VMMIPTTATTTPMRVMIASLDKLDEAEAVVVGGAVVVGDGGAGTGAAYTARLYIRAVHGSIHILGRSCVS
jgi:hypothetical protein